MVKIITDWLLPTPLDELQYICNKIIGVKERTLY